MLDIVFLLIVFGILVLDWRLRNKALRCVAIGFLLVALYFTLDLGPALRRALAEEQIVMVPRVERDSVPATPFASGVIIMKREGDRDLKNVWFPTVALIWLALTPVFRREQVRPDG